MLTNPENCRNILKEFTSFVPFFEGVKKLASVNFHDLSAVFYHETQLRKGNEYPYFEKIIIQYMQNESLQQSQLLGVEFCLFICFYKLLMLSLTCLSGAAVCPKEALLGSGSYGHLEFMFDPSWICAAVSTAGI